MAKEDGLFLAMTSQILHVMGAATGFALAAFMVKRRWVDCENWDLFSVMQNRHMKSRDELAKEAHLRRGPNQACRPSQSIAGPVPQPAGRRRCRGCSCRSSPRKHQFGSNWQISDEEHVQIIAGLRKAQKWEPAMLEMVEYLKAPAPRAPAVRLALAQVLIEQLGRPRSAQSACQARRRGRFLPHSKRAAGTTPACEKGRRG